MDQVSLGVHTCFARSRGDFDGLLHPINLTSGFWGYI